MVFADRDDAGRRLAAQLEHLRGGPVVVLGLPRGGVPVGLQVARALGAPLDVIVVRKLGVRSSLSWGWARSVRTGCGSSTGRCGLAGVPGSERPRSWRGSRRSGSPRRALPGRAGAPADGDRDHLPQEPEASEDRARDRCSSHPASLRPPTTGQRNSAPQGTSAVLAWLPAGIRAPKITWAVQFWHQQAHRCSSQLRQTSGPPGIGVPAPRTTMWPTGGCLSGCSFPKLGGTPLPGQRTNVPGGGASSHWYSSCPDRSVMLWTASSPGGASAGPRCGASGLRLPQSRAGHYPGRDR